MTDQRPLHERVLDIAIFAPVGLLRRLRDDLPSLVSSGRREVEERVRVAHWIGEMSVTYGRAELKRRLTSTGAPGVTEVADAEVESPPPFDGYDELPADRLVQVLSNFPVAELALIRVYEQRKRGRRTVLAKIDQLIDS
ncbi:MAG: hypothetical protein K8R99_05155 [Actinomycetia bacterium]|nr:hypothetical protein [Actinomycetes bacterium]